MGMSGMVTNSMIDPVSLFSIGQLIAAVVVEEQLMK